MNKQQLKEINRLTNNRAYLKGYDDGAEHRKQDLIQWAEGKKCPIKKNHPKECHYPIALGDLIDYLKASNKE